MNMMLTGMRLDWHRKMILMFADQYKFVEVSMKKNSFILFLVCFYLLMPFKANSSIVTNDTQNDECVHRVAITGKVSRLHVSGLTYYAFDDGSRNETIIAAYPVLDKDFDSFLNSATNFHNVVVINGLLRQSRDGSSAFDELEIMKYRKVVHKNTKSFTTETAEDKLEYLKDNMSSTVINRSDFVQVSAIELYLLRNLIYAKHGYIFSNKLLSDYFSRFKWYVPVSRDVTQNFNNCELENIQTIIEIENNQVEIRNKNRLNEELANYIETLDKKKNANNNYENLINNCPNFKDADVELNNTWTKLKETLPADEFEILKNEQKQWLIRRETLTSVMTGTDMCTYYTQTNQARIKQLSTYLFSEVKLYKNLKKSLNNKNSQVNVVLNNDDTKNESQVEHKVTTNNLHADLPANNHSQVDSSKDSGLNKFHAQSQENLVDNQGKNYILLFKNHLIELIVLFFIITICYGVYLGWSNKAIFYFDKKDLLMQFVPVIGVVLAVSFFMMVGMIYISYFFLVVALLCFVYNGYRAFMFNENSVMASVSVFFAKSIIPVIFIFTLIPTRKDDGNDRGLTVKDILFAGFLTYVMLKLINGDEVYDNLEKKDGQPFRKASASQISNCSICGRDITSGVVSFRQDDVVICQNCYVKMSHSSNESNAKICSCCGKSIDFNEVIEREGVIYCGECFCNKYEYRYAYLISFFDLDKDSSFDDLKSSYRRLILKNHPDKVAHMGPEIQELARKKTIEINQNYEELKKYFDENK